MDHGERGQRYQNIYAYQMTNQQRGHVPVPGAGLGSSPPSIQTTRPSNGGAEDVRVFRDNHSEGHKNIKVLALYRVLFW